MKKPNYILIVLRKELLEIVRDKRTLIMGLLIPLLLNPIIYTVMGRFAGNLEKEVYSDTSIAFTGPSENAARLLLAGALEDAEGVSVLTFDDPAAALEDGDIKVLIAAEGTSPIRLTLVYDANKIASSNSMNYVSELIAAFNSAAAESYLAEIGVRLDDLYPVSSNSAALTDYLEATTGIPASSGSAGLLVSMVVPSVLVMILSSGGMATAIALFAGEKDKKTFEPLLTTRAGRYPVLIGKYIAVNLQGLATGLVAMIGLFLGFALNPGLMAITGSGSVDFRLPMSVALLSILLVVLISMVFCGIHVMLSAVARSTNEAGTYSSFLTLISMLASLFTMYLQAGDVKMWMTVVPVLNIVATLKMVLAGLVRFDYLLSSIISTALFLNAVLFM